MLEFGQRHVTRAGMQRQRLSFRYRTDVELRCLSWYVAILIENLPATSWGLKILDQCLPTRLPEYGVGSISNFFLEVLSNGSQVQVKASSQVPIALRSQTTWRDSSARASGRTRTFRLRLHRLRQGSLQDDAR